jgi:membrane protease YdiL (CAAX protease family)
MTPSPRPRFAALEFCLVIGLCFGTMILGSFVSLASSLHATAPRIPSAVEDRFWLAGIIVFELVAAIPVTLLLWQRGWRRAEFPWRMGPVATLQGIGLAVTSVAVMGLAVALASEAVGDNGVFEALFQGTMPALPMIAAVSVVNGAFEEIFVLGYIIRFFERRGFAGWQNVGVATSTLIRLLYHTYQGPVFATGIALMGVGYALLYLRLRNLWVFAWAHMLLDFFAFLPGSEG